MFKSKLTGKKKKTKPAVKMVGSKIVKDVKEEDEEAMSEASDATFIIEPGESSSFIISETEGVSESKTQSASESRSSVTTTGKVKTSYITTYIDSDGNVTKTVTDQSEQELPSVTQTQYEAGGSVSESKNTFRKSDKISDSNQTAITTQGAANSITYKGDVSNVSKITDGSQISENIQSTDRRVSQSSTSSKIEQRSSTSFSESRVSSSKSVSSKVVSEEQARSVKSGKDFEMIGSQDVKDDSNSDFSTHQQHGQTTKKEIFQENIGVSEIVSDPRNIQNAAALFIQEERRQQGISSAQNLYRSDVEDSGRSSYDFHSSRTEDRLSQSIKPTAAGHDNSFDENVKRSPSSTGGAKLKVRLVGSKLVKEFSEDPAERNGMSGRDYSRRTNESDSIQQATMGNYQSQSVPHSDGKRLTDDRGTDSINITSKESGFGLKQMTEEYIQNTETGNRKDSYSHSTTERMEHRDGKGMSSVQKSSESFLKGDTIRNRSGDMRGNIDLRETGSYETNMNVQSSQSSESHMSSRKVISGSNVSEISDRTVVSSRREMAPTETITIIERSPSGKIIETVKQKSTGQASQHSSSQDFIRNESNKITSRTSDIENGSYINKETDSQIKDIGKTTADRTILESNVNRGETTTKGVRIAGSKILTSQSPPKEIVERSSGKISKSNVFDSSTTDLQKDKMALDSNVSSTRTSTDVRMIGGKLIKTVTKITDVRTPSENMTIIEEITPAGSSETMVVENITDSRTDKTSYKGQSQISGSRNDWPRGPSGETITTVTNIIPGSETTTTHASNKQTSLKDVRMVGSKIVKSSSTSSKKTSSTEVYEPSDTSKTNITLRKVERSPDAEGGSDGYQEFITYSTSTPIKEITREVDGSEKHSSLSQSSTTRMVESRVVKSSSTKQISSTDNLIDSSTTERRSSRPIEQSPEGELSYRPHEKDRYPRDKSGEIITYTTETPGRKVTHVKGYTDDQNSEKFTSTSQSSTTTTTGSKTIKSSTNKISSSDDFESTNISGDRPKRIDDNKFKTRPNEKDGKPRDRSDIEDHTTEKHTSVKQSSTVKIIGGKIVKSSTPDFDPKDSPRKQVETSPSKKGEKSPVKKTDHSPDQTDERSPVITYTTTTPEMKTTTQSGTIEKETTVKQSSTTRMVGGKIVKSTTEINDEFQAKDSSGKPLESSPTRKTARSPVRKTDLFPDKTDDQTTEIITYTTSSPETKTTRVSDATEKHTSVTQRSTIRMVGGKIVKSTTETIDDFETKDSPRKPLENIPLVDKSSVGITGRFPDQPDGQTTEVITYTTSTPATKTTRASGTTEKHTSATQSSTIRMVGGKIVKSITDDFEPKDSGKKPLESSPTSKVERAPVRKTDRSLDLPDDRTTEVITYTTNSPEITKVSDTTEKHTSVTQSSTFRMVGGKIVKSTTEDFESTDSSRKPGETRPTPRNVDSPPGRQTDRYPEQPDNRTIDVITYTTSTPETKTTTISSTSEKETKQSSTIKMVGGQIVKPTTETTDDFEPKDSSRKPLQSSPTRKVEKSPVRKTDHFPDEPDDRTTEVIRYKTTPETKTSRISDTTEEHTSVTQRSTR
ncbi:serine-rich adhesin for platelets-like [Halyomorpha halys]|uniref:serine-rich adhesin for platelets-like n=1 Tax=Halyomorpha halys TaxID=286706 RepID=UPI0034D29567